MICTSCGNAVESVNRFCPKCGAPVQPQAPPQYESPPPYSAPQAPMSPMMGGPAPTEKEIRLRQDHLDRGHHPADPGRRTRCRHLLRLPEARADVEIL